MEQKAMKEIIKSLQNIDTAVDLADDMNNAMVTRAMALASIKKITQNIRNQLNKDPNDLYPELP